MTVDPLWLTSIGWNTTVKVPSRFWVTDWNASDGANPAPGPHSAGAPEAWLLTLSSGQMPLGSTSVTVMAELSVYSPASTCNVYVATSPPLNSVCLLYTSPSPRDG